jgi:hypothetical protein
MTYRIDQGHSRHCSGENQTIRSRPLALSRIFLYPTTRQEISALYLEDADAEQHTHDAAFIGHFLLLIKPAIKLINSLSSGITPDKSLKGLKDDFNNCRVRSHRLPHQAKGRRAQRSPIFLGEFAALLLFAGI